MQIQDPSSEQLQLLPKNLARWHLGARLLLPGSTGGFEVIPPSAQDRIPEGILLQDDETAGVSLDSGSHHFVIDLGRFHNVGRFMSMSFGATGRLKLSASDTLQDLTSPDWVQLGREVPFQMNDIIDFRFPLTDTRYLWVEADIEEPGELGNFSAMGILNLTNVDYAPKWSNAASTGEQSTGPDAVGTRQTTPFDFGTIYSGARVSHVSDGDPRIANFLIDDDLLTYYEIPGGSTNSVMIFDLQEDRDLESISLIMESGPGTIEVYFSNKLPFDASAQNFEDNTTVRYWSDPDTGRPLLLASSRTYDLALARQFAQNSKFQTIEVDTSYLEQMGVAHSVRVETGEGRIQVPIPRTSARFVIIRWIPEVEIPMGLRIFEVSMIGRIPTEEPVVEVVSAPTLDMSEFAALANEGQSPVEIIPPVETVTPDVPVVINPGPQVPPPFSP